MKHIIYNKKKCIGCGNCAIAAPNIWEISKADGKANLIDAQFKKDNYFRKLWLDENEIMKEIVQLCLTNVIKIV